MTITDFLEARIAEDEALAEAASVSMHGQRHTESWDYTSYVLSADRDSTEAQDKFITEWWPSRVLAECAAKRAIIGEHKEDWAGPVCVRCRFIGGYMDFPCPTIRALAAVYSSHEDYDSGWAL